jgi:hypothetical protein
LLPREESRYISTRVPRRPHSVGFVTQPTNNRGNFEAQISKIELSVLRTKLKNSPPPWFWGSTKKPTVGFEAKSGETIAISFDVKLEKTIAAGFKLKLLETVATSFEAKSVKTVRVVLRLNHSQTVDLDFKAQPRNMRSLSSRARCRPHTASPDLSTVRPSNIWHVWSFPVLCIRSATPTTILVAARHVTPAHHETNQHDSPNEPKIKEKQNKIILDLNSKSLSQWLSTIKLSNWPLGFSESQFLGQVDWIGENQLNCKIRIQRILPNFVD